MESLKAKEVNKLNFDQYLELFPMGKFSSEILISSSEENSSSDEDEEIEHYSNSKSVEKYENGWYMFQYHASLGGSSEEGYFVSKNLKKLLKEAKDLGEKYSYLSSVSLSDTEIEEIIEKDMKLRRRDRKKLKK